ncbi:MAG: hypothetical protein KF735_18015 [Chelatococcus sp.]|uniref:hypothetical protein n=1 Tax=Chelatococcus sp. TaxID=1953771 RepID=UPI0025BFA71E|nr:hypothetical protein [Chelatococcus sp.]MBX3539544.1 hypothetical protein [Chelatococcus sp.]
MRFIVLAGLVTVTLMVAGCVGLSESKEEIQARHRSQCNEFGFRPKTDAFANCMMQRQDAESRIAYERSHDAELSGLRSEVFSLRMDNQFKDMERARALRDERKQWVRSLIQAQQSANGQK